MAQESSFPPNQTAYLFLGPAAWPDQVARTVAVRRNDMHPEELMKPDLLSEIVLLTFGTLILASLVLFVATMLDRS
jgi:hypothetical protein